MERRFVFSVSIVAALTGLSIVAFATSLSGMPVDDVSGQRTVSETVVTNGQRKTTGSKQTVIKDTLTKENAQAAEMYERPDAGNMDFDIEESYLLGKIAMAEAEGEDIKGKALVMRVVLNRVYKEDEFPDSIKEVIYQPGQFSPVADGRFDEAEPDADCWEALAWIMRDGWDESLGATYFESKSESTWHSENLELLFRHGKHYFYEDKEGKQ